MPTVFDVADYLVAKFYSEPDFDDDLMTHMKLQKLVYYSQCYHLFRLDMPLFPDSIEAWKYGPVCPVLYDKYKQFGRLPILPTKIVEEASKGFTEKQIDVMDTVLGFYGSRSASDLSGITHRDLAWKRTHRENVKTIDLDELKQTGLKHFSVGEPYIVEPTKEELEYLKKRADELGLPDSLDCLNE